MAKERIDAFERRLLELAGASPQYEGLAARILEEGATPFDLLNPPGRRLATVGTAILIRAARPPFKFRDNRLFGKSVAWEIPGE